MPHPLFAVLDGHLHLPDRFSGQLRVEELKIRLSRIVPQVALLEVWRLIHQLPFTVDHLYEDRIDLDGPVFPLQPFGFVAKGNQSIRYL